MKIGADNTSSFSPKAFLKARRPERFSDSVSIEIGKLDRSVLEYQLATLNKRNLELAFESFAKKLCEKIICPNLLEQTGPVAGGDGKVDTQTFPVSEQSKALWYIGINENSNSDRWAFAISTQEDWKKKCHVDVRKIQSTDRDYKKVFCITNMYTKSNQRSEVEDSLSKETGMDVRILDISWILDQVFKNGYEQLAIDSLSIDVDWRREVKVGANDYTKSLRYQEIEKNIENEINASRILPHQIDWLLEIAVLSKELEKPLLETQGLFLRAVMAADRFGTSYHKFNAHYQYAWAAYWWFEDIKLLGDHLLQCLALAKDICMSGQWRDSITLLSLYLSHHRRCGDERSNLLDIKSLIAEAEHELNILASRGERPSNSLMSKAYLELLKLHSIENIQQASEVFDSLLLIVQEGERLVGFSFTELYDLITQVDELFGELESYENLLDHLVEHASQRDGETNAALLWLKRGARRLDSEEPFQAIKLIGKSLSGLYKQEVKEDLYSALNILSAAYSKVGLLWAARANLLFAASIVTDDFWKSGDLVSAQVYAYFRLAKLELQLGRINYALEWWKLACLISSQIEDEIISENDYQSFDAFLSQCILNASIEKLNSIRRLPDLLDEYQLYVSRSVLLFSLGHEEQVEREYELKINQEYIDYLKLFRDTDLGAQTPEIINCDERRGTLIGSVMGCEIRVTFPFRSPLVELAETLLSAIEAFLATSLIDQMVVVEPYLYIEISADDDDEIAISHELDELTSDLKMKVLCSSFSSDMLNISGQNIIQQWMQKFVLEIFYYLTRTNNLNTLLESMLGEDRALERSVSFGSCFVGLTNIMGNDAVKSIKSILLNTNLKEYSLLRTSPWDKDFPKPQKSKNSLKASNASTDNVQNDSPSFEQTSHKDIKIQSLIKTRLWDKTVWKGAGFSIYSDGTPALALMYENENAAKDIFIDLHRELSTEDRSNRLKISIIRHINKKFPANYRICISENISPSETKIIQTMSRIQTMEPENKNSIELFLKAYEKSGRYILSYGFIKNGKMVHCLYPDPHKIIKFDINVIDAWKIGPNDIEIAAIQNDDDPIIPEGVEKPPFFEALKSKYKNFSS